MPAYEFICNSCGMVFEKTLSFKEDISSQTCPLGHHQIRRIYAAPAIVFKGSGWYSTDSRSKKSEKANTT